MKPGTKAWVVSLIAVAAIGCATGGEAGASRRAGAAEGDSRAAIEGVLNAQAEAWNRGDLDAFMDGYWRSPELVFTSGGAVQRGWQTTLDRYRATYGSSPETMGRLAFSDLEVHSLGPAAAWALGYWELDHGGETMGGVFSLVFREIGGRWVIVHDHTSLSP